MQDYSALEQALGYTFTDARLLVTALTHSSWINENKTSAQHNERLEYLGDAVLELCVSWELYSRFPHSREGDLTCMRSRLVSTGALASLARELGLESWLRLGRGEDGQGGRHRDALLSDAFEAVLGAVFTDGGYEAARCVVGHVFGAHWPRTADAQIPKDCKTRLQEFTQRLFKERPVYTLVGSHGPEHAKLFEVRLELPDGTSFTSQGNSVKRAEQQSAHNALLYYHVLDD